MFFNKEHNKTSAQKEKNSSLCNDPLLSNAIEGFDCKLDELKHNGIDLTKHIAQVQVVVDISGSMKNNVFHGNVQKSLTRLLPAALRFDDNGKLEVFVFNRKCHKMKIPMTKENYSTYVNEEILRKGYQPSGGTKYAPIIIKTLPSAKKLENKNSIPVFCIVITDGDNSDKELTNKQIIKSSHYNIFYQFIGIVDKKFDYLNKLDNLRGRVLDNTGFLSVNDINKMSNDELYTELLKQYIVWLNMKKTI